MNLLFSLRQRFKNNLQTYPDALLTLGLLAVAVLLVIVALLPDHRGVKAGALAWTVLP